jgi:hypothetical protein
MAIYTFYFRNGRGATTSFDFAECVDDAAALEHANVLLASRDEARAVEVIEGQRVVTPLVTLATARGQTGGRALVAGRSLDA